MIGSRLKIKLIYDELLAEKLASSDRLAQVYSPIGLDIGSVSVWEIAMSIAAELVWVRQGKKGSCQPLRQLAKGLV
jgi:xanthine dehydrogenase accessory factor